MDKFSELAQKRANLLRELAMVESAITEETKTFCGFTKVEAQRAEAKPRKEGAKRGRKAGDGPSLKKIIIDLLTKHKDGMQLKEIVGEVTKMIAEKKYESKASNVTNVVQQALNQLKGKKLVQKNAEKKYQLVQTAA